MAVLMSEGSEAMAYTEQLVRMAVKKPNRVRRHAASFYTLVASPPGWVSDEDYCRKLKGAVSKDGTGAADDVPVMASCAYRLTCKVPLARATVEGIALR